MAKRPMAKPNTTTAMPVRTQARNVRSFARWSLARSECAAAGGGISFGFWSAIYLRNLRRVRRGRLFYDRFEHCVGAREIIYQVIGNGVALLEIARTIVREPDFAIGIFPD